VQIAPAVARVFERDRRQVTMTFKNTLMEPGSGRIAFELPEGLSVEPAAPTFGPIKPGESGQASFHLISNQPRAGRHTIPYRITYRTGPEGEIPTQALGLSVMVGATLEPVYQHPQPPVFVLHAPKMTAKFDMFHGLCRSLADDDDTVRLADRPLFTLSDGKTDLLTEKTSHAFTWPRESPASLTAHAYDRCRWQMLPVGTRLLFRMDAGWTQFEKTHVTIPGHWHSPKGPPQWQRVVALDATGKEYDAQPKDKVKVSAAELAFPDGRWNLAFKFEPPQEVTFNGLEMRFELGSLTGDNFQIGFAAPGGFDAWRGKK
jgi:hypothetical protein